MLPAHFLCFLGEYVYNQIVESSSDPKRVKQKSAKVSIRSSKPKTNRPNHNGDNGSMAIKAVAVDDANTHRLIIGLNRENIESLLRGDVFTLPHGMPVALSEDSDIVLLFAETDDELGKRFPPSMRPV
jgi:hypothetical protein